MKREAMRRRASRHVASRRVGSTARRIVSRKEPQRDSQLKEKQATVASFGQRMRFITSLRAG